jgi:hypothetical protein
MDYGKIIGELKPGKYTFRIPLTDFVFRPRGTKTPDFAAVDRILIEGRHGLAVERVGGLTPQDMDTSLVEPHQRRARDLILSILGSGVSSI